MKRVQEEPAAPKKGRILTIGGSDDETSDEKFYRLETKLKKREEYLKTVKDELNQEKEKLTLKDAKIMSLEEENLERTKQIAEE